MTHQGRLRNVFFLSSRDWWRAIGGHVLTYVHYIGNQIGCYTWWRHQMDTFSAELAFCVGNSLVTGEFPAQRPVTWSFDVFFDLRPNKWLNKQ